MEAEKPAWPALAALKACIVKNYDTKPEAEDKENQPAPETEMETQDGGRVEEEAQACFSYRGPANFQASQEKWVRPSATFPTGSQQKVRDNKG